MFIHIYVHRSHAVGQETLCLRFGCSNTTPRSFLHLRVNRMSTWGISMNSPPAAISARSLSAIDLACHRRYFCDIVVLMEERMSTNQFHNIIDKVGHFSPRPFLPRLHVNCRAGTWDVATLFRLRPSRPRAKNSSTISLAETISL